MQSVNINTNEVLYPPKLHTSLFTTAAINTIDYDPSSATARIYFMVQAF